jgi:hypothetical protein
MRRVKPPLSAWQVITSLGAGLALILGDILVIYTFADEIIAGG